MADVCDLSDLPVDQCACWIHKPAEPTPDHEVAYLFKARHNSTIDCQHDVREGDVIARTVDGDLICSECAL